jgi:hypothetical protein
MRFWSMILPNYSPRDKLEIFTPSGIEPGAAVCERIYPLLHHSCELYKNPELTRI